MSRDKLGEMFWLMIRSLERDEDAWMDIEDLTNIIPLNKEKKFEPIFEKLVEESEKKLGCPEGLIGRYLPDWLKESDTVEISIAKWIALNIDLFEKYKLCSVCKGDIIWHQDFVKGSTINNKIVIRRVGYYLRECTCGDGGGRRVIFHLWEIGVKKESEFIYWFSAVAVSGNPLALLVC